MAASFWEQMTPYSQLGLAPSSRPSTAGTPIPGVARSSGPGVATADGDKPWHPDNALFWFGALALATTLGLIGASVQFKAGPARASASAGTT